MHQLSSAQRYRLLANHAVEHAMIVLDTAGTIVEWSRGAERLLGWTAPEAIGQPSWILFTPEDRAADAPKVELDTSLVLGRGADVRWHLRKDGSTVFCDGTINTILDADGVTVLGYGKVMREAYSFRKELPATPHAAASEQRSFLAAVLESVENGIVACDPAGRLTFFNDAARAIHGLEEAPLPFDQWAEHYNLYHADGVTRLAVDEIPLVRALRGERVNGARVVVLTPAGQRRDVHVSGRALLGGAGQILGAVISMNDVTSLRAASDARDETTREHGKRVAAELAEGGMRKTQAQLYLAAESARLGIWTWDVRRDTGTWENERMYEIFNVAPGAPILSATRLMAEYLHPDDAPVFRQSAEQTFRVGGRFHFTGRYRPLPEHEPRWLELSGIMQTSDAGDRMIIGTAADITERKQTEEVLRNARLRLEATMSAGDVASWIWDIVNDRVMADDNLSRLFGIKELATSGAPLASFTSAIHPDDLDEVLRQIRQAIASNQPYRATYRVHDREHGYRWIDARGRVEYGDAGEALMLAGVTFDVTEQRELQDRLRVAEERYRTLITSIDEAFGIIQVLVDEEGRPCDYRFEEVNASMEKQSGLVNAAGKTIREMVPGIEQKWIERYGHVALSREAMRFTEHSAAMGYWWDVYAMPVGEPEERRLGILFTDVTARRQAEENLRQVAADLSEANRRKTEFLATLAHELRNPLAPLRTGLDLMRLAGSGTQAGSKVHEMMDRQLRQMVHLIDDLMDVSRINSGKIVLKRDILDLKDAVTNAVEAALPAIEAAHHALDVRLPPEPVRLWADPTRLAQILGNLLTNAVKYTPPGGRIALSARLEDGMVAIAVTDTGIGIPPEEQARVFELFSQVSRNMGRAQGGLGIGLSLVRSLVEMHGGGVAVSSPGPGQGTTFTIRLPVADAGGEADADDAASAAAPAAPVGLRIVVADDNVDAANMLASLLAASGHTVEPVHNGAQALERAMALRPDLAILDIGMPGLNGYEVAERIRAAPGTGMMVLVALTGWGGELDRTLSARAGFDAHLTKPAGLPDLEQALLLARARRADG